MSYMRRGSEQHEHAMVRAAELYFIDGLAQSDIADRLRLSRWKVGRLIEEARAQGIVEITIHHPSSRNTELERALVERFGIDDAVVINSASTTSRTLDLAASAGASYLSEMRPAPRGIALSWGRSVAAIAGALEPRSLKNPRFMQLNGGAASLDGTVDAASIMRTLLTKSQGASTMYLPVQAIASSHTLAKKLMAENIVARTFAACTQADLALYALGGLTPSSVLVQSGAISPQEQAYLQQEGCVGDILGHYIGPSGNVIDLELDARTIALGLDKLALIPTRLAVGIGQEKAGIVLAALKAGLCTVILTESKVARSVLAANDED